MLTDQAKKTTLLHAHTHAWADRRATRMHHSSTPQLQLKSCSSSFAQHLPQAWRRLILWHKWKGTQKKNRFSSQPSACHTQDRHRTGRGVAELSLCCFSTRTKSCRWQQCPFHALHSTHIPSFAHGRGQTPYLPLEISLETWRDEWETEREREWNKLAFKFVN